MRKLLFVVGMLCWATTAQASDVKHSLTVVIDNSAALQGSAEAELFKRRLLFQLSEFRKQRDARNIRIHIVTVNNPRNVFVGTPRDLFKQGRLGLVLNYHFANQANSDSSWQTAELGSCATT